MEQSDESTPSTGTKNFSEDELRSAIAAQYYKQPEMVRFLLAENLALKTFLMERRLLTPEEFAEHKKKALEVLDKQIQGFIDNKLKSDPKAVALIKAFQESRLDQHNSRDQ